MTWHDELKLPRVFVGEDTASKTSGVQGHAIGLAFFSV